MKEYPVQLRNVFDLIKFEQNIRKEGIHGRIKQKSYETNVRSTISILLALPLDSATVIVDK